MRISKVIKPAPKPARLEDLPVGGPYLRVESRTSEGKVHCIVFKVGATLFLRLATFAEPTLLTSIAFFGDFFIPCEITDLVINTELL